MKSVVLSNVSKYNVTINNLLRSGVAVALRPETEKDFLVNEVRQDFESLIKIFEGRVVARVVDTDSIKRMPADEIIDPSIVNKTSDDDQNDNEDNTETEKKSEDDKKEDEPPVSTEPPVDPETISPVDGAPSPETKSEGEENQNPEEKKDEGNVEKQEEQPQLESVVVRAKNLTDLHNKTFLTEACAKRELSTEGTKLELATRLAEAGVVTLK